MELATLNLDTYKVVKLLQSKGYTKKEAEGFIEAIQEITLSGVATKQDVQDLKEATKQDIQDLKESTKQDIQAVRNEIQDVRNEIQETRNEMLKFQIIQTITIVGVMIALFQIF